jgi:hypothetical protein
MGRENHVVEEASALHLGVFQDVAAVFTPS